MSKKHHKPPAPPAPPTAAKPAESLLDQAVKLAGIIVFIVGLLTLAGPWLRRSPPAGWVCWDVIRSTAADTRHGTRCEPAAGWHVERWPGGEQVAVPDVAAPARRHFVSDRF